MSRKSKSAEFVQEGFNITVTGRNVHVSEPMKDYAMEKLSKLEKFGIRIIDVVITMDVQKIGQRVDMTVKLEHLIIKSHATTTDMYASIDQAVDKIQNQLRRYHSKIKDHQAKGIPFIDMNVNVLKTPREQELLDFNGDIEAENIQSTISRYHPHNIVEQEKLPLKVLTNEEALMKMELSGNAFLIFRSQEDMKLKVIYRRSDDNFGIIEPEA